MSDYPTEVVSRAFFGDKEVKEGMTEKVKVISVDEDKVQIQCLSAHKGKPDVAKEVSSRYHEKMNPPATGGGY